jgi:DNA (cytosine-5)-methyltransferase 1
MAIKIVDLFAGPGGLGEGFCSINNGEAFKIAVSAEMESSAHETLTLRSFFRAARGDRKALRAYYNFCNDPQAVHPRSAVPNAWHVACDEARQLTLGDKSGNAQLDEVLRKHKLDKTQTVVIGGPPCQAYSLVGRAKNRGTAGYVAEDDARHFLYREYLRILHKTKPAVFVMENVKGILSAQVGGRQVFHDILCDLTDPTYALKKKRGIRYTIHSLVMPTKYVYGMNPATINATDFVIRSEQYGIPQARHRVILLGVREEMAYYGSHLLAKLDPITVADAIGAMPPLRSRLGKDDSAAAWHKAVASLARALAADAHEHGFPVARALEQAAGAVRKEASVGALRHPNDMNQSPQGAFERCMYDPHLKVWLNHEARSHMTSDLGRYLYAAVFAKQYERSPKGHAEFALPGLAPAHANWESGKFADRFKVQRDGAQSSTITSHISKDGHYFIHPDPTQCRSLTVREAARLQTFPDNYFFQGNRTQQYHQVGNAVPPLLAQRIASIVLKLLC